MSDNWICWSLFLNELGYIFLKPSQTTWWCRCCLTIVFLSRGAPIRIFEADHRKQYRLIRSPIPIFLKPSFYHVELFIVMNLMIQSRFVDVYSGPEFHFFKWIPLLGNSCKIIFNLNCVGGHFFDIFQKYIFISHLNVWSCSAFFVLTIIQLLPNSLHTAWFHELYVRWAFYTWFTQTPFAVCMQSTCST